MVKTIKTGEYSVAIAADAFVGFYISNYLWNNSRYLHIIMFVRLFPRVSVTKVESFS